MAKPLANNSTETRTIERKSNRMISPTFIRVNIVFTKIILFHA